MRVGASIVAAQAIHPGLSATWIITKQNDLRVINQRMPFNLKKVCPKCKPETVKKYLRDIQRLRILSSGTPNPSREMPPSSKWLLAPSLFKKYQKIPLEKRRALSIAAVKAGYAYGLKENKRWYDAMIADVNSYKQKRSKQNKSVIEKEKWG